MYSVYILLPVHNRKEITLHFINSLVQQDYIKYHLILIDDGSSDGTDKAVFDKVSNLSIIRGNGNLWWAGGLQKGIDFLKKFVISRNDIILFINDDACIPKNFLKTGVLQIINRKNTIVRATQYCDKTKQLINKGITYIPDRLLFEQSEFSKDVNIANSNGLFIKWEDVLNIGDFKPKLLPHYLSDYEYTYRAYRKGYTIFVDPGLKLYLNRETTGFHSPNIFTLPQYIKTIFSKKSANNPIYLSVFVLLTSQSKNWTKLLSKIWKSIIGQIYKRISYKISDN